VYTIISQEDMGYDSILVIDVSTDEVLTVNQHVHSPLEKESAEHLLLHTARVKHDHRRIKYTTTLLIVNPVTPEKIEEMLEPVPQMLSEVEESSTVVAERCVVDGIVREFYASYNCPDSVRDALLSVFPDEDVSNFNWIAAPVYHSIINEEVISVFTKASDIPLLSCEQGEVICTGRKYCMSSGKYYDRRYVVWEEASPLLPSGCKMLSKSYNLSNEHIAVPDFYDLYFKGDSETIESFFDLPHLVGSVATCYGATIRDGEVVRVKQYCYDTNSGFHNWEEAVELVKKDALEPDAQPYRTYI